ncbi:M48 family metallopeptidase [Marinobacter salinisoli]|uniref:M48 family metallopeptidase n=1 Tax=Marinobacter salinisoli TaxID=2769486 RepID=A0ABX7MQ65_9GAMM|nr:M48 family metallopeptidase [Marinobacter salinisoli]QSP94438.1 M48 family metallopeptidase [Marinobacter salinisoli]
MSHQGFFQRQAKARRNTSFLVLLFLTAVTLITLAVCLVGYFVTRSETSHLAFHEWLLSQHGLTTSAVVIALIGIGSLVRWVDLAGGGTRVAKMVGARPIDPDTRDHDERRLRNIVEEMAIASGVPVPELYVMDQETGINAFVAGYTTGEAVMVVTHGALTQLSRDELQGVIGHEFSHILNGDMRINIRLIALLAGILMIGQIGGFLLRVSFYGSPRSSRSSRDGRAQAAMGIVGLALVLIGYVGVFFGRLIQSAVSRQREMLADASSVQFTRNPEGIASALYKIGLKGGYLDTTSHASDMNHMCFGESTRMKFASLLASHPPVEDRINAIQPGMLARLRSRFRDARATEDLRSAAAKAAPPHAAGFSDSGPIIHSPARTYRDETTQASTRLSDRVGTVTPQSEAFAIGFLNQLPDSFRAQLNTRTGAVQLCYALLICGLSEEERQGRLALIPDHPVLGAQHDAQMLLIPTLRAAGDGIGFPALELAMPALRKLDPDERRLLKTNVQKLVAADRKISLFELALTSFLSRHLGEGAGRNVPVRYRNYRQVVPALQRVLSLMARAGTSKAADAETLFQRVMASFTNRADETMILEKVSLRQLREALTMLNGLSPLLKPAIIDACGDCIIHDGKIEAREYELMRLVADQLDCPMPPLTR